MTEHKNLTAKEAIQNFQKAFGYTGEAIKKALAYCGSIDKNCEDCVFCDEKGCEDMLKRAAIGLIERQGAEIERKIFAEIKKAIKEEALDYCNGFEKSETRELQEYYKTKRDTAIFLYMKIDYLERKYTEGKENGKS